jgi:hypothetical protein
VSQSATRNLEFEAKAFIFMDPGTQSIVTTRVRGC